MMRPRGSLPYPASVRSRSKAAAGRRMVLLFAAFALLVALGLCLTTFVLDPLQFYRKASLLPPVFSTEERYQNPGLAKNYDYDTIIIGTSMTENFLPSVVDKALKGKTMKLSMQGSLADEQRKIAELALKTGKVKRVLWGLDYFAFKTQDAALAQDFPDYLYDDNWLNDYRYWFNVSVYEMMLKDIVRLRTSGANRDLEHLYNWNADGKFGAVHVVNAYRIASRQEQYFGLNEEPLEVIQRSFETNVLSLAKRYPEVEFIYFYPPYSILRQEVWRRTNEARYRNQLEMSVWMFEQLNKLPNTKVYNFQAEADWTFDLDLYKDLSHHTQDVNTWIAESIGRDDPNYRMTADNAASFGRRLEEQLDSLVVTADNRAMRAEVELREGDRTRKLKFASLSAPSAEELLVPAKEAAAAIGGEAVWSAADKTLTLRRDGRELVLRSGEATAWASDGELALVAAPQLRKGTWMVPLLSILGPLGVEAERSHPDRHTLRMVVKLP